MKFCIRYVLRFFVALQIAISGMDAATSSLQERYTYQEVEMFWKIAVEPLIPRQDISVPWPLYLQALRQELLAHRLSLVDYSPDLSIALFEWRSRYQIAFKQSKNQLKELYS